MVTYGKACKFSNTATEQNPWESLEGTEMSKEAQEYHYADGMTYGVETLFKRAGWAIPILGLKTYIVKSFHDGKWTEYKSPNKTLLRKKLGSHNIIKIMEVK